MSSPPLPNDEADDEEDASQEEDEQDAHSNSNEVIVEVEVETEKDFNVECNLPGVGTVTCIPSVLTFYRKDPLLLRNTGDEDEGENDDDGDFDDDAINNNNRGPLSPRAYSRSQSCTMAQQQRRRSWSPIADNNSSSRSISMKKRGLNFFSKYAPASASTSSLTSLLAKTTKQLTATTTTGYTEEERAMIDGHLPTEESCLSRHRD